MVKLFILNGKRGFSEKVSNGVNYYTETNLSTYNILTASNRTIVNGKYYGKESFFPDGSNNIQTNTYTTNASLLSSQREVISRNAGVLPTNSTKVQPTVGQNAYLSSPQPVENDFRIRRNYNKNAEYLIYPFDMSDKQDRIEFRLFEYNKPADAQGNIIGPQKKTTPEEGPIVNQGLDESKFYKDAYVTVNGKNVKYLYLPIQDKIQDMNNVKWGEGELNDLQRRLVNMSYNLMSGDNIMADKSGDAIKSIFNDPQFGNLGKLYLAEQATSTQNLFSRTTGQIINPNLELLFEKPTLRPFTFNFRLSPRSSEEAEEVKRIINFFKKASAVRTTDKTLFLKAPLIFGIKYLNGANKQHQSINQIKKCALVTCNVDYTPNNTYMTFNDEDATMVSYNMNMTFQELLPIYDKDYQDNHKIGY
jgi:hypothetical protein